jgi:hypothetical protein
VPRSHCHSHCHTTNLAPLEPSRSPLTNATKHCHPATATLSKITTATQPLPQFPNHCHLPPSHSHTTKSVPFEPPEHGGSVDTNHCHPATATLPIAPLPPRHTNFPNTATATMKLVPFEPPQSGGFNDAIHCHTTATRPLPPHLVQRHRRIERDLAPLKVGI